MRYSSFVIFMMITFLATSTNAQVGNYPLNTEMNKDEINFQIEKNGIPSGDDILKLRDSLFIQFNNNSWDDASMMALRLAKKANFMVIVLKQGLIPYNRYIVSKGLIPHESNQRVKENLELHILLYTGIRDKALVMRVECYKNVGENIIALNILGTSFQFIDIKYNSSWIRANKLLIELLEAKKK